MNYYTADLHLGHKNILRLSNRPFSSIEEMDKTLINNWNSVVKPEDDVYIVGDLCFRTTHDNMLQYISQLNGKKHLIVGNHDGEILKDKDLRRYFVEIKDIKTVYDNGTKIVLCHYPMVEWDGYYRGTLHFYGHIHNNFDNATSKYIMSIPNAYNVGVDILDYYPRTLKEIIN